MGAHPNVVLAPGQAERIMAGHPWIFRGAIATLPEPPPADGDIVEILDHKHRFLGVGFFNAQSKISVRVLSFERVAIDEAFFETRCRAALAVRQRHMPDANCLRVVSTEADFLSGLIADRYEDVLVVQFSSLGMERRKALILDVLHRLLEPRVIVERSDVSARRLEGLPEGPSVVHGTLDGPVRARVGEIEFAVDVLSGQKTGMYLDQQLSYRHVAALSKHIPAARVLDCFTYLGGFGLHCARAGAARVHLLDQSEAALASAMANAAANGLAERCTMEAANVFDWLKAQAQRAPAERPRFDLIVLDPPPFARGRASVPGALRGYKEIHLRALKLLEPGGILATFCCSHHVGRDAFEAVIVAAARDARKILRRIATYDQAPDHPVIPTIPETEYLKGYAFEVVGSDHAGLR